MKPENDIKPLISIVSPVYRAEKIVDKLVERITEEVLKITENFEIILVEDGSPDNSWQRIAENCQKDTRVKGIKLSRNFGQHYAITAGLDYTQGEWVVVMDCDLQDDPRYIQELYAKALEGFDVVWAIRKKRKDRFFKRLSSAIFHRVFKYFTGIKSSTSIGNFGIYNYKIIESIRGIREQNRSLGLFVLWSGFNKTGIEVEHNSRETGQSSYNIVKLLNLAFDTIIAQSNKLLMLSVRIGIFMAFFSFLFGIWIILQYFVWGIPITGWASFMVSLYFLSGLLMLSIGILGIYIGKIFNEVKHRPLYLVDVILNFTVKNK